MRKSNSKRKRPSPELRVSRRLTPKRLEAVLGGVITQTTATQPADPPFDDWIGSWGTRKSDPWGY
jgi:hypothetical protein